MIIETKIYLFLQGKLITRNIQSIAESWASVPSGTYSKAQATLLLHANGSSVGLYQQFFAHPEAGIDRIMDSAVRHHLDQAVVSELTKAIVFEDESNAVVLDTIALDAIASCRDEASMASTAKWNRGVALVCIRCEIGIFPGVYS